MSEVRNLAKRSDERIRSPDVKQLSIHKKAPGTWFMCLVWFVRDHLNLAWERYSKKTEHKKRTEQSYILLLYYWKIIFNLQLNDHVCCSPQKRCRDQKALFNIKEKRDTICIDLNYRFNFDIGLICTFQSCWAYRSLYMICYMQKVKIKWNAIDWPPSRV